MIRLELNQSIQKKVDQAKMAAEYIFRPISRKYDTAEHQEPVELKDFGAMSKQAAEKSVAGGSGSAPAADVAATGRSKNGRNLTAVSQVEQLCWGDTGLMLARPGSGLGNAAIAAVGTDEQRAKFGPRYAAMAITEPGAGSDSKNISTTADRIGDQWVLNGEKIYVTDGSRCDCVVVWATIDKALGKGGIKSFLVEKEREGIVVERLEKKLGIRASDTATIRLTNCRIPAENILGGEPKEKVAKGTSSFGGVMQTFDNTRPLVASMAVGVGQAAIDMTRDELKLGSSDSNDPFAVFERRGIEQEVLAAEAEVEASRLLVQKAAWMMDNKRPNSIQASIAKAKAGRVGNEVTLQAVEWLGEKGYSEEILIEKFSRDSKILDIFEGTQQIQQLVVARGILNKSSKELK